MHGVSGRCVAMMLVVNAACVLSVASPPLSPGARVIARVAAAPAVAAVSARLAAAPVVAAVSTRSLGTAPAAALSAYKRISEEHYLAVAATQSGILRASSDAVSQLLRDVPFDPAHSLAMGTMGVLFSGLLGGAWLAHLEERLPGATPDRVVQKAAADYFCYAPCANSAYLFFVPLLTLLFTQQTSDLGAAAATAAAVAQNGFAGAMALELSMFAPYNLLSFRLIPAAYRAQTTAAACALYTIALSSMC
jgi:hypothetical protein